MGVDSLLMVEVQLAVERRVGLEMTVMELSKGFSVSQLAAHLLGRLEAEANFAEAEPNAGIEVDPESRVDDMSDQEVEGLLDDLLPDEEAINA